MFDHSCAIFIINFFVVLQKCLSNHTPKVDHQYSFLEKKKFFLQDGLGFTIYGSAISIHTKQFNFLNSKKLQNHNISGFHFL